MKKVKFNKKTVVIHSGGLDSSLCLALAAREFGKNQVLSLSFRYGQRHSMELFQAAKICQEWNIDHVTLTIDCLQEITDSSLLRKEGEISHLPGEPASSLVVGRNGLMARLGAIHANYLGAHCIYMGIIEEDAAKLGYRDCTREYMDLKEKLLRMDLQDPAFEVRTPLVHMSKKETLELSYKLGILDFLLEESISCYEGIPKQGCRQCPTCKIRNQALSEFLNDHPEFDTPH